jgi:hypothetical protein
VQGICEEGDAGGCVRAGARFFATEPDLGTFRLSFATTDTGTIEEGAEKLA